MLARCLDRVVGLFIVLIVVGLPTVAGARQAGRRVGARVITRFGTVLRADGRVVDDENRQMTAQGRERNDFRVYRVRAVQGHWVWLVAEKEDVSGWVQADQVIPLEQAVEEYTGEIHSDPTARAYTNRGNVWQALRELDPAIADYTEAIKLEPTDAIAYSNRGLARLEKKDYTGAIADFDEAIKLAPRYVNTYEGRGAARWHKKDYTGAIADFDEAIKLDPRNANAYNARGWLRATAPDARFRDGKKAVESATHACDLTHWKEAYCLGTLAAAYAEAGDFDAAVRWQEKAQGLYGDEKEKREGHARLELYRARIPYRAEPGSS